VKNSVLFFTCSFMHSSGVPWVGCTYWRDSGTMETLPSHRFLWVQQWFLAHKDMDTLKQMQTWCYQHILDWPGHQPASSINMNSRNTDEVQWDPRYNLLTTFPFAVPSPGRFWYKRTQTEASTILFVTMLLAH
jgi:hypothetical protein